MEPTSIYAAEDLELDETERRELAVRDWRAEQLRRLGLPYIVADKFADLIDWHELADLVDRGCPVGLALEIVS
jgi:hypothetical protein